MYTKYLMTYTSAQTVTTQGKTANMFSDTTQVPLLVLLQWDMEMVKLPISRSQDLTVNTEVLLSSKLSEQLMHLFHK